MGDGRRTRGIKIEDKKLRSIEDEKIEIRGRKGRRLEVEKLRN